MAGDTYCANCGSELPQGARFCPGCGAARGTALGPTVIDQPDEAADPALAETVHDDAGRAETGSSADSEAPSSTGEPDTVSGGAAPAQELDPEPHEDGQPTSAPPPRPREAASDRTPGQAPGSPQSPAPGGRGQPPPQAGPAAGSSRPGGGLGDAAELARRLGTQARRPAVAAALAGGGLAALATLAFGLAMAVAFPDTDSLVGALGTDASIVTEALRQSVSFLQVPFDSLPFPETADQGLDLRGRTAPLLLLAVPIGACALAAVLLVPRTRGAAMLARAGSCAGVAVAFAAMMLIAALLSGDANPSLPGTFFLALLWGGVGVCAGVALALRREALPAAPDRSRPALPPLAGLIGRAAVASLRPLGVLLLITGLLGTGAWVTHSLVSDDNDENRARATVEIALFAAEHSVHFAELGAFVPFEPAQEELDEAALPAPTAEPDEITGDDSYRIFAYRDALPAYLFVPGVILLIALPLLLALYAGFTVAGAVGVSRSPGPSAAWGAIVGPVWAISMLILDVLATKPLEIEALGRSQQLSLFGSAEGAGALLYFLLVGGALGALGGLLAASTDSEAGIGGARPSG